MSTGSQNSSTSNPRSKPKLMDQAPDRSVSVITKRERTPRSSITSLETHRSESHSLSREMIVCLDEHLQLHSQQISEMANRQKNMESTANTMVFSLSQALEQLTDSRQHHEAVTLRHNETLLRMDQQYHLMKSQAEESEKSCAQQQQMINSQQRDGAKLISEMQTWFRNQSDRIGVQEQDTGAIKQHLINMREMNRNRTHEPSQSSSMESGHVEVGRNEPMWVRKERVMSQSSDLLHHSDHPPDNQERNHHRKIHKWPGNAEDAFRLRKNLNIRR